MRKVIAVSILSLFPLLVSDVRVPAISDKKEAMDRVVWERLVHAICMVESGCDDNAKNKTSSACGRFQMLRVYVDEVNRIKGKRTYSYNDRFDPLKAREMFEIYQQHYNPNKDIDRAIILHRGKVSKKYIKNVKENMRYGKEDIRCLLW
jgi:hypothetical protein